MSFFEANYRLLEERFGSLTSLLESSEKDDPWVIHRARSGMPWAQSRGVSLCSRHDPQREARRLLEKEQGHYRHFCFLGLGLAYLPEAVAEKFPDSTIILIESHRSHFRQLLESRDLSSLLKHEKLFFLIQEDGDELTHLLKHLQLGEFHLFRHRVLYNQHLSYYQPLDQALQNWINRKQVNRNTLKIFGKLWIRNFAANLPLLCRAGSLEALENRFSGMSAVIAAAGPSLEPLLPELKELGPRTVLIAVDTAYRSLLQWGIKPHFLLITDPQYWNSRHLDFCSSDTIMISDSSTCPRVFRHHPGPLYFSASPFPLARPFEQNSLGIKLRSGGSVATAAWDFARILGCKTIYMAGLDLGYPGKQTHSRGSYFEERSLFYCNRIQPLENLSWQALHSAPLKKVPAYKENQQILTDQRMEIYIQWFKETLAGKEVLTKNLSDRGVKIEGMPCCSIEELQEESAFKKEHQKSADEITRECSSPQPVLSKQELKALHQETLLSLSQACQIARDGWDSSLALKEAYYQGKDIQTWVAKLDKLDQELMGLKASEAAGFLIEPMLEEMLSRQDATGSEAILQNSLDLYRKLSESLDYHYSILNR